MAKKAAKSKASKNVYAPVPSMEEDKYSDWAIRDCADTLIRAEEIRADPKKMKLVAKEIDKRKKALDKITSIEDLKDREREMDDDEEMS